MALTRAALRVDGRRCLVNSVWVGLVSAGNGPRARLRGLEVEFCTDAKTAPCGAVWGESGAGDGTGRWAAVAGAVGPGQAGLQRPALREARGPVAVDSVPPALPLGEVEGRVQETSGDQAALQQRQVQLAAGYPSSPEHREGVAERGDVDAGPLGYGPRPSQSRRLPPHEAHEDTTAPSAGRKPNWTNFAAAGLPRPRLRLLYPVA